MYVISVTTSDKHHIKAEGYISRQVSVKQLVNANVIEVTVDPSKEKKVEQIDRVFADIQTTPPKKKNIPKAVPQRTISIDEELKKAKGLYEKAKSLHGRVLDRIRQGQDMQMEAIEQTTDKLVESIFRNQDALSCLSRIQTKDAFLLEHSINVAILMSMFARHLGFEKRIVQEVTLGAFLHDIGKVLLPDEILNKRGHLNEKEEKIWQSHVALGLKVLEDSPSISHIAARMIAEHHERLDGSGFPKGIKENDISKFGRMIAIVDTYEKMTGERPFKKPVPPISAFKTLVAESPALYDEDLVEKFIQCIGVYPVGTLVKLNSGKLGIISQLNPSSPLRPYVRVFYNTRLNQAIPIEEINLSKSKYKDQIDRCIQPEEFNINLMNFFKAAFID